jgi:hypothetical protein
MHPTYGRRVRHTSAIWHIYQSAISSGVILARDGARIKQTACRPVRGDGPSPPARPGYATAGPHSGDLLARATWADGSVVGPIPGAVVSERLDCGWKTSPTAPRCPCSAPGRSRHRRVATAISNAQAREELLDQQGPPSGLPDRGDPDPPDPGRHAAQRRRAAVPAGSRRPRICGYAGRRRRGLSARRRTAGLAYLSGGVLSSTSRGSVVGGEAWLWRCARAPGLTLVHGPFWLCLGRRRDV